MVAASNVTAGKEDHSSEEDIDANVLSYRFQDLIGKEILTPVLNSVQKTKALKRQFNSSDYTWTFSSNAIIIGY